MLTDSSLRRLHLVVGMVLPIAMIISGAYALVPASGRILALSIPDWFWVAVVTVPACVFSMLKKRTIPLICSICCFSLAFSIYFFGSVRADAEQRQLEEILSKTRPQETPQTVLGAIAPEIDSMDMSGAPMRLSQFRGKIVLLVFWASWCGPCMRDVEHEKELFERFRGRPFEIVGVNCDFERESGLTAVESYAIPWQSFWDEGDRGPISRLWGVIAWPSIFVIDHEGIIRFNYLRGDNLDIPLEILIKEAEAKH